MLFVAKISVRRVVHLRVNQYSSVTSGNARLIATKLIIKLGGNYELN